MYSVHHAQAILKGRKHNLKREQALEPDVARILELSAVRHHDRYAKGSLMDEVDTYQTDGQCKHRDRNPKKEPKINFRVKNNRNGE